MTKQAAQKPTRALPEGALLKAAREKQGLSIEVVHEATKIPLDALRGIEEGYQSRSLSPFYYKGFLKIYAQYLGVDLTAIAEGQSVSHLPHHRSSFIDNNALSLSERISQAVPRHVKQRIVIVVVAFIVCVLLFKLVGAVFHFSGKAGEKNTSGIPALKDASGVVSNTDQRAKASAPRTSAPTQEVRPLKPVAVTEKKKEVSAPAKPALAEVATKRIVPTLPKKQPTVPKQETVSIQTPVETPRPAGGEPLSTATATKKKIILTARARKSVWLRVTADKVVVFQSTLNYGAVETWLAYDTIEISGKNIDQLELELNGKLIGTLGRKDRNAKRLIVTQDGLSVQK